VTRDDAYKTVNAQWRKTFHLVEPDSSKNYANWFVDCLEALGVLTIDTIDDQTFGAAAERLTGARVNIYQPASDLSVARLNLEGALEVMDVLRKSGFRITKE
jgi:hypothetical protein